MLRFERPEFLWLLLVVVPLWALAWHGLRFEPFGRWLGAVVLRTLVVVALVASLAKPWLSRPSEGVATVFVLDRSRSIPPELLVRSRDFAERLAAAASSPADRAGFVTFGREAQIVSVPGGPFVPSGDHVGSREGSDLGAALRLAMSILPDDARSRIVLASDGNETVGGAIEAAELAAARGIPVDVIPIDFEFGNEVVVESLRAPARVRPGQSVELRLLLRSRREASGTMYLRDSGRAIDLDPDAPGDGLALALVPGPQTIVIPYPFGSPRLHRFEAIFEPTDGTQDGFLENNRATAATLVEGSARVLVLDPSGGVESGAFVEALAASSIDADVLDPSALAVDPALLAGYDAVVLANVARWRIDGEVDRLLRAYVHDLGGGLLMLGGPESFGAGGWIGSEVAEALPVRLDPPATRSLLRGSVAIVLDASGSMSAPAMGAFASKQSMANEAAIAGLRSMSRLDEVCVIAFDGAPRTVVPRREVGMDGSIERRVRGITSGGGTDLHAAMRLAIEELDRSTAGTKHLMILTDGRTVGDPDVGVSLAEAAIGRGISVSTIGIEEGAQDPTLARIAEVGGGRFHPITDLRLARELPRVFMREISIAGRRLTLEGAFQPIARAPVSGPLRGVSAVPPIEGYVVTLPRDGLADVDLVHPTSDGVDPIFASWNFGLGRAAAFASDAGARWTRSWPVWSEHRAFWEQTMRWLMRPVVPSDASVRVRIDGDAAIVDLEVLRADGSFDTGLDPEATLLTPDGTPSRIGLETIGPGRWRASVPIGGDGTSLASFALGSDATGRRRSIQASIDAPYSREFLTTEGNRATLARIAERTGGRVIELSEPPETIDAYLQAGTSRPAAAREAWDLLAVLAGVLFLLDAAFRRIVIDWRGMRLGALAAARVREPGAESIVALRQVRRERPPEVSWIEMRPGEESAPSRATAGSGGIASDDPREAAASAGSTTEALLRAKRRAQEADRGPDDAVR